MAGEQTGLTKIAEKVYCRHQGLETRHSFAGSRRFEECSSTYRHDRALYLAGDGAGRFWLVAVGGVVVAECRNE